MSHNPYYNYHTTNYNNNRRQSQYSTGHGYSVTQTGNIVATGYTGHQRQIAQHPGWRYLGHRQGQSQQDVRSQVASSHHYTQIISSPSCQVRVSKCALGFLTGWFNVWFLKNKQDTPSLTF